MNRKTKILLWIIVFLSFAASPIYGREYILFGNKAERPALSRQSLNDTLLNSGIEISSMKRTFHNLGAVTVELSDELAEKFKKENPQTVIIPADIKLYSSISGSYKMMPSVTIETPWHVLLSRELQNYSLSQNADFDQVRVFVLDSGVQRDHADLYENLQMEYALNFNGGESDDIVDEYGHGTQVAGVIAGKQTGVCPYVKLIPLKVADNVGVLNTGNLSGALDYIIGLSENELSGKKIIINLSFNSALFSSPNQETEDTEFFFDSVLSSLKTAGIVMVSSAGNDESVPPSGSNVDNLYIYPTKNQSSNYISAAAVNSEGKLMDFSHYGPTTVETAAPGYKIETTTIGSTYATVQGTSFSSPFVAGVAAIIWALEPSLVHWEVRNLAINAVRGVEIGDNFIDEYRGSENTYLFTGSSGSASAWLESSAAVLVIAGQPISPSTVANNPDNPANPYGSFPVDNKSEVEKKIEEELDGCNVTSAVALPAVLLIPVIFLLIIRK